MDKAIFRKATEAEKQQVEVVRESVSYWKDATRRFLANKVATGSLVVVIIIAIFAIFGPLLSHFSYNKIVQGSENLFPSADHWFGTDNLGRDLFARCMIGARISLSIGIVSCIMVTFIGVVYGSISGYFGGNVDSVMMRIVDVLYSIPTMLVVILLSVVFSSSTTNVTYGSNFFTTYSSLIIVYIVLALLYWMDMARLVRGQILSLKHNEYVTAAHVMGASNRRIITKHLIPNTIGTIIVSGSFYIPQAIFLEAFLSFIGLGVSEPLASLGSLAQNGLNGIYSYPYQIAFPLILISVTILAFNLIGDGLRDALDPRLKGKE